MANFFKSLAKGLLYFVAFPGIIIAVALYTVFGVAVFIFQFFKLIYLFFTGRNLFSDLPEDTQVKSIVASKTVKSEESLIKEKEQSDPFLSPVYGSDYTFPFKTADKDESTQEEKPVEEPSTLEEEKDEEGGNEDD